MGSLKLRGFFILGTYKRTLWELLRREEGPGKEVKAGKDLVCTNSEKTEYFNSEDRHQTARLGSDWYCELLEDLY